MPGRRYSRPYRNIQSHGATGAKIAHGGLLSHSNHQREHPPPQSTPPSTFARPPPFPARQDPGGAVTPRCRSVRDLRARPGQGRGAPGDFRFCSCVLRLRRRSRGRRVAKAGQPRGRPTEARTYCAGGGRRSADGPHLPTFAGAVETKAKRGRGTRGRLLPLRAERASNLVSLLLWIRSKSIGRRPARLRVLVVIAKAGRS